VVPAVRVLLEVDGGVQSRRDPDDTKYVSLD
jgi:hypothetical protein